MTKSQTPHPKLPPTLSALGPKGSEAGSGWLGCEEEQLTFFPHPDVLAHSHVFAPGLLNDPGIAIVAALPHLLQKEKLAERRREGNALRDWDARRQFAMENRAIMPVCRCQREILFYYWFIILICFAVSNIASLEVRRKGIFVPRFRGSGPLFLVSRVPFILAYRWPKLLKALSSLCWNVLKKKKQLFQGG